MVNAQSEVSVRRPTSMDLRAAEELVVSHQKRMTATVLGTWEEEESLPRVRTTSEAPPELVVDGGHRHLLVHAPLNGAA